MFGTPTCSNHGLCVRDAIDQKCFYVNASNPFDFTTSTIPPAANPDHYIKFEWKVNKQYVPQMDGDKRIAYLVFSFSDLIQSGRGFVVFDNTRNSFLLVSRYFENRWEAKQRGYDTIIEMRYLRHQIVGTFSASDYADGNCSGDYHDSPAEFFLASASQPGTPHLDDKRTCSGA